MTQAREPSANLRQAWELPGIGFEDPPADEDGRVKRWTARTNGYEAETVERCRAIWHDDEEKPAAEGWYALGIGPHRRALVRRGPYADSPKGLKQGIEATGATSAEETEDVMRRGLTERVHAAAAFLVLAPTAPANAATTGYPARLKRLQAACDARAAWLRERATTAQRP